MSSELMKKMMAANKSTVASILSQSDTFNNKDMIPTGLPILDIAFSGDVDGGMVSGLTVLSGESATFKSLLGLYCMKAYLTKHKDAIAIFWDSEGGITPEYMKSNGIDTDRILHIPVEHLEQLKFDMVKRISEISKGDKVFLFVDSLGGLGSKKELEDAMDEKSVADMTRAKSVRGVLRLVTPMVLNKDIPCIVVNHIYKNIMVMYGGNVQGGGTSVVYFATQIFEIGKSQEKDGDELIGWNFTINISKSRFVRSKAKLPFTVLFDGGINKWSGLFDIAVDANLIAKTKSGWYALVDTDTGEISDKNFRQSAADCDEILGKVIKTDKFKEYVKSYYRLGHSTNSKLEEDDIFEKDVE